MKMREEIIRLGFEFSVPSQLKVVVPVKVKIPIFGIFECIIRKISCLLVNRKISCLKGHCSYVWFSDMVDFGYNRTIVVGLETCQMADKIWNLTHKVRIKDRHVFLLTLSDQECETFDGCVEWTADQLKVWLVDENVIHMGGVIHV